MIWYNYIPSDSLFHTLGTHMRQSNPILQAITKQKQYLMYHIIDIVFMIFSETSELIMGITH